MGTQPFKDEVMRPREGEGLAQGSLPKGTVPDLARPSTPLCPPGSSFSLSASWGSFRGDSLSLGEGMGMGHAGCVSQTECPFLAT